MAKKASTNKKRTKKKAAPKKPTKKAKKKTAKKGAKKGSKKSKAKAAKKGASKKKTKKQKDEAHSFSAGVGKVFDAMKELSHDQRERLVEMYEDARKKVTKKDVEYAIEKGKEKLNDLGSSTMGWLRRMGRQAKLLWTVLRDWWHDEYEMPWKSVSAITAAMLYLISPFDLIPDFIPVLGLLDDAFVIGLAINLIQDDLLAYCEAKKIDPADHDLPRRKEESTSK